MQAMEGMHLPVDGEGRQVAEEQAADPRPSQGTEPAPILPPAWRGGRSRWRGESICVHEYSHTFHNGVFRRVDSMFQTKLSAAFDNARSNGLPSCDPIPTP